MQLVKDIKVHAVQMQRCVEFVCPMHCVTHFIKFVVCCTRGLWHTVWSFSGKEPALPCMLLASRTLNAAVVQRSLAKRAQLRLWRAWFQRT